MTLEQFAEIFALLAVQLRATDADEATIRGYYEALKDLEPEWVALAATDMAKRGGSADRDARHWFPKTSEWREAAEHAEGSKRVAFAQQIRALHLAGHQLCEACSDTGWRVRGDARYIRCECTKLRRLELLGRRPWPALAACAEDQP